MGVWDQISQNLKSRSVFCPWNLSVVFFASLPVLSWMFQYFLSGSRLCFFQATTLAIFENEGAIFHENGQLKNPQKIQCNFLPLYFVTAVNGSSYRLQILLRYWTHIDTRAPPDFPEVSQTWSILKYWRCSMGRAGYRNRWFRSGRYLAQR